MPNGALDPRRANAIETCTIQLHSWKPFQLPTTPRTLESSDSSKPYSTNGPQTKRPCRADRTTSFSIDAIIDMSKLSLVDDDKPLSVAKKHWFAKKRRRRGGSRSVSGRSSDRSGTRRRCCSVGASAAYGTCSDFPMATGGTDSSGELFLNVGGGEANWSSDVSEAVARKEKDGGNGSGERENVSSMCGQFGNLDSQGNESGYGSEPGYRGDAELGYGDEFDEEEDEQPRLLFWGEELGDSISRLERVGENSLQKAHHRGRRKKHDLRIVGPIK